MTVEIPNIRRECDVRMYTTLKDNGVVVDWSTVENVRAFLFNESKRIITGECLVSADPDDDQVLVVDYLASSSQELGVNRLVIRVTYHDRVKTYDKLALNFVSITALATGMTILEDPTFAVEVDAPEEFVPTVGIDVAEVSTSVLDAAIDAAIAAAKEAEEAAREARDAAEAAMEAIADCPTREEYDALLAGKVDKEDGKGLSSNDFTDADKAAVEGMPSALEAKQDVLVSGENIKTINGQDILGEGDIEIHGGGGGGFEPTSEQLAAMDSGITSNKVAKYDGYATEKQDAIDDLAAIRSGASKGATAVQPADLPTVPTKLSDLEDDATHRLVTDAEKSKWNGKQDRINDLATIRSGAARGATSVQPTGDQRIDGRKIFSDLRVVEETLDETILFEAGYEAESDLLRLNINDTYDGESVVLGHVADPVLDFDAVNKQTLEAEISKVQPGKTYAFAISPDMYDIEFDPTKGVDPYNKSYGYTNITIHEDTGVEWVEGGIYTIMVRENVSNTYRNGRVRIGKNGTWYPLVTVATNQVITASNILNENQTTVMVFKKNAYPEGALHCLYVTTYSLITQAEIDAGTSTASRLVSPKLLMENYGSKIAALETRYAEDAALLAYANEVTGAGDTDLGEAVRTLAAGYGGGGEKAWKLVADYEKSDKAVDSLTTFADGTPLDAKELLVYSIWESAFTSLSNGYIGVYLDQIADYALFGAMEFGTTAAQGITRLLISARNPFMEAEYITANTRAISQKTPMQLNYGALFSGSNGPYLSEGIKRIQVRPNAMTGTARLLIYAR